MRTQLEHLEGRLSQRLIEPTWRYQKNLWCFGMRLEKRKNYYCQSWSRKHGLMNRVSLPSKSWTGIVYKPIICRLLRKLTIWFVRLRPWTTFNGQDHTVQTGMSHDSITASVTGPHDSWLPWTHHPGLSLTTPQRLLNWEIICRSAKLHTLKKDLHTKKNAATATHIKYHVTRIHGSAGSQRLLKEGHF